MRLGMGAAQVITIDPIYLNQGVDNWAITHVFDFLARAPLGRFAKSPADFTPELAESWTISPDARTWTFHLRKGVQFHKGYGELTSDDVKFTFDRVRDPKQGSGAAILYSNVDRVETPDPYTAVIVLKQPDPFFMSSLIHVTSSNIVCKKAVLEKGDKFARDPIGSGPYQVVERDAEAGEAHGQPRLFRDQGDHPEHGGAVYPRHLRARARDPRQSGRHDPRAGRAGRDQFDHGEEPEADPRRRAAGQFRVGGVQPEPQAAERSARAAGVHVRDQQGGYPQFADAADAARVRPQSAELPGRADRRELPEGTALRLRSGEGEEAAGATPGFRTGFTLAGDLQRARRFLIADADHRRSSCARSASTWT